MSGTAGEIDLNQELADPVEADMMGAWDRTMNAMLVESISQCASEIQEACTRANTQVAEALCK